MHGPQEKELSFGWTITCPFYIAHMDLLLPGYSVLESQEQATVINCMCDLIFLISSFISALAALSLEKLFIENVIFTFGMAGVLVIYSGSKLMKEFSKICTILC